MIVLIVSLAVAFGVSFLCSFLEAALLSLTPGQIADISQRRPRIGAIWQAFKKDIEKPIAVILIINTAAHTIGAAVAGAEFDNLFGTEWIWLFSLVFTAVMIQYTEILPKTLGVRFNQFVAIGAAFPLRGLIYVLNPFIRLIHFFNRPFEMKKRDAAGGTTLEEISVLAGLARLTNQIGAKQERIIRHVPQLSQLSVEQIMIPIENVAFISTAQTLAEALVTAHVDSHTRFPVCENGDKNQVIGYVNFKEIVAFMRTNPNERGLKGIIRPIGFSSPRDSAASLLEKFTGQHLHMAIVRDDNGKSLGLVTLEDIVEELVGDLEDEFDRLPRMLYSLSGDVWSVGGGVPLKDLALESRLPLPEAPESVSTWILGVLGRQPQSGESFTHNGIEIVVRRTRRGKVFEANFRKL